MPELPPPKILQTGEGWGDNVVLGEDDDESPWDDDKCEDGDFHPNEKNGLVYSSDNDDVMISSNLSWWILLTPRRGPNLLIGGYVMMMDLNLQITPR